MPDESKWPRMRQMPASLVLAQSKEPSELSRKLQELKHMGPVTARIFLREIRPIWYRKLGSSR
jgi:hypothetical protein